MYLSARKVLLLNEFQRYLDTQKLKLFMLDEESSEEEPEKFFNADREPGQKPPTGGCCLGPISILVLIVSLLLLA